MKKIIRISLIIIALVLIVLVISSTIFIFSGSPLPAGTNQIISKVQGNEIPELVKGKSGFARNGDVSIWYESILPRDTVKSAVLLIMGISCDALAWPETFFEPIVNKGYQVIRYDNRGTGMSDWIEDWDKNDPYTMDDLAQDGFAVLDELNIDNAHIIGVSMGGMIAQQMAINYPDRVLSLVSMLSSGYIEDPDIGSISWESIKEFARIGLRYGVVKSEKNMVKLQIASRNFLKGDIDYDLDIKAISEEVIYNMRRRKSYNLFATNQQATAISSGGSRYEGLKNLEIPVLIIHGTSDPLIDIQHGKKCASLIPKAESLWIEGMGHDIPDVFMDQVLNRIFDFLE